MPLLNIFKTTLYIIVLWQNIIIGRTITKIVDETDSYVTIKIVKSIKTEADLAANYVFIGLPIYNYPKTEFELIPQNIQINIVYEDDSSMSDMDSKNLSYLLIKYGYRLILPGANKVWTNIFYN